LVRLPTPTPLIYLSRNKARRINDVQKRRPEKQIGPLFCTPLDVEVFVFLDGYRVAGVVMWIFAREHLSGPFFLAASLPHIL